MKTERRHELETNELANSLTHWLERIKPYSNAIIGLAILVLVLIFGSILVSRRATAQTALAWDEYFQALNRGNRLALQDLSEKYPDSSVGWWSRLISADFDLNDGTNLLFTRKAIARERLHAAVEGYREVREQANEDSLQQRATFGLARANEALGEIEPARDLYRSITTRWAHCPFAKMAEERAKDLNRQETKEFYDWFAKQDPGKKMLGQPGTPGEKPAFDIDSLNLPAQPSGGALNFPDFGKPTSTSTDEPSDEDSTADPDADATDQDDKLDTTESSAPAAESKPPAKKPAPAPKAPAPKAPAK